MTLDLTRRLTQAREAARTWAAHDATSEAEPDARAQAAAAAITSYVEVDAFLTNGAPLPGQWTATTIPEAEEVAEALQAVALIMPIERASVMDLARMVVKVMGSRRSPVPVDRIEEPIVIHGKLPEAALRYARSLYEDPPVPDVRPHRHPTGKPPLGPLPPAWRQTEHGIEPVPGHGGGIVQGPDGTDSVPVVRMPGEQVYHKNEPGTPDVPQKTD